jgi:hypothetical protein
VSTLKEILCTPTTRPRVVQDAARLVESEVDARSGLSGLAIKAAFKAVQTLKPGLVTEVVDHLLEKFVDRLEPFHKQWVDGGKKASFESFLVDRRTQVANALLAVTDERAKNVQNKTLKSSYEKLRPKGEKEVEAAVPGLARTLSRYLA